MLKTKFFVLTFSVLLTTVLFGCNAVAEKAWSELDPRDVFSEDLDANLILLLSRGKLDKASRLVSSGANVNAVGLHGLTPIYFLVSYGNSRGVEFLLENGANPNARSENGRSAMHIASLSSNNFEVLKMLLEYGGNPSELSLSDELPLNMAISRFEIEESLKKVRILLSSGADPNSRSGKWGVTPLMDAVMATRYDIASVLLKYGADVCMQDGNGNSLDRYYKTDVEVPTPQLRYQVKEGYLEKFDSIYASRLELCKQNFE